MSISIPHFTYHISSNNRVCDFRGSVPVDDQIVPVTLLDINTLTPRTGNFYVERIDNQYCIFKIVRNRRVNIYIYTGLGYEHDWEEEYFKDHINALLADKLIEDFFNHEEYIEVDSPHLSNTDGEGKRSSGGNGGRRVIKRKYIKTVKDKFYIAKGLPQSGKSEFMCDLGIKLIRSGKSSIILFRLESDRIQFDERLCDMIAEIRDIRRRRSEGADIPDINVVSVKDGFSTGEFIAALKGDQPKIFLCLGNESQLNKLNEQFAIAFSKNKEDAMSSYVLIIDEADFIDSNNLYTSGKRKGEKTLKSVCLDDMKKYAYAIVSVSATVLDIAARDDVLPSHLYILNTPLSYRGIPSFKINITDPPAKFSYKINDNLLETDKALLGIVESFDKETIKRLPQYSNEQFPNILLINVGDTIEPQLRLLKDLRKEFPELVLMNHVGDGIYLWNESLVSPIKVKSNSNPSIITDGIHLIKDCSPSAMLLWLKKNTKNLKFVIITGELGGRSTSYGCKDKGDDLPFWHLTHYRLVLAKSTVCPNVIQKAARLATIFETSIPLKLYVSQEDSDAIILAHWVQEEVIQRSKMFPDEEYLKTIMANLEFFRTRKVIPKGRELTLSGVLKIKKGKIRHPDEWKEEYDYDTQSESEDEDNKSEEEANESEEEDESKNENKKTDIFKRVNISNLTDVNKPFIASILSFLDDKKGVWITRAQVISDIIEKVEELIGTASTIRNTEYRTCMNNMIKSSSAMENVSTEKVSGLIFRQMEDNRWQIRLNA